VLVRPNTAPVAGSRPAVRQGDRLGAVEVDVGQVAGRLAEQDAEVALPAGQPLGELLGRPALTLPPLTARRLGAARQVDRRPPPAQVAKAGGEGLLRAARRVGVCCRRRGVGRL
jgi:hypothetical protein